MACLFLIFKEIVMKKLLLIPSLLAMNAYACPSDCAVLNMDNECLLNETICVQFFDESSGKYGIKDKNSHIIIPAQYDSIAIPNDDIDKPASYITVVSKKNNGYSMGLFNDKGEMIATPRYEMIQVVHNGIMVQEKDLYGLLDFQGRTILPTIYDYLEVKKSGMMIATARNRVMIDDKGAIIKTTHYPIINAVNDDRAIFCGALPVGLRCGLMDKTGQVITPATYHELNQFSNVYDGSDYERFLIADNGKKGLIDINTGKVIVPLIYDYIGYISEDMLEVKIGNKYGFVNIQNQQVIKLIYDYVESFDTGLAKVAKDGEQFYIDKTGKRVP